MRIAILVGVSKYQSLASLPACKADVDMMHKLVRATAKYDEVLCLPEDTTSLRVKDKITEFIKDITHREPEVEEVFFYYTGHGGFYDNEFYYLLSDFKEDRRRQTSLENSEVDDWLRSFNAALTVKVVDACHAAGRPYVKEDYNKALERHLEEAKGTFDHCYFMFSSEREQVSRQDENFSLFTRYFLEAVDSHPVSAKIRYKHIMDYISDNFGALAQNPFFVMQARNYEEFCSVTEEVKHVFDSDQWKRLMSPSPDVEESLEESTSISTIEPSEGRSLLEIVKKDAQDYCTEDEVTALFDQMKDKVEGFEYQTKARELYEITHSFSSISELASLPDKKYIGRWLDKQEEEVFASVVDEYVEDRGTNFYDEITMRVALLYRNRSVPKKRIITGFKPTSDCPFEAISIQADPRYLNVPWGQCIVVILVSKMKIYFFYFYGYFREESWTERTLVKSFEWKTIEKKLRDREGIWSALESIQQGFETFVMDRVKLKFGLVESKS